MTTWYQRMLPYPLLAPWTEDYQDSSFGVDVPEAVLRNGSQIKVDLVFRLYSETLRGLIENQSARYAVEVSCPRTFVRSTHVTSEQETLSPRCQQLRRRDADHTVCRIYESHRRVHFV